MPDPKQPASPSSPIAPILERLTRAAYMTSSAMASTPWISHGRVSMNGETLSATWVALCEANRNLVQVEKIPEDLEYYGIRFRVDPNLAPGEIRLEFACRREI